MYLKSSAIADDFKTISIIGKVKGDERKRPAAASAPADCSRTVREVRRRPAPEQSRPPLKSLTEHSVRDFSLKVAKKCPIFAENVSKKVAHRRATFGEERFFL